ncbi:MAG: phosphoglucomutase (alpha-D-glucose-1,6-bisphosphate-dependent) [Phycisphaerae bacterium]
MTLSALAGKPAPASLIIDVDRLVGDYYAMKPDVSDPRQLVAFGTSGHRGTVGGSERTFTEAHIVAITQAIVDYRTKEKISGPLFMGKDTHALSTPAEKTALEVLAANGVETIIQSGGGFTPTPVVSWSILTHNRGKNERLADGIVITPSHNPPSDGGFKYNPTNGGPADTDITGWIQNKANDYLKAANTGVKRMPYEAALRAGTTHQQDLVSPYVRDLPSVIDIGAIRDKQVKIGADPLGGASVAYWERIAEVHKLNLTVVNKKIDPTFSFMSVDHDGRIRMDCSSPYAMAGLVKLKDQYAVAVGNDPDADRHGIITPSAGLMNPNHYLAVAIQYLLGHRPKWSKSAGIGKTVVSSSMIDRVVADLGRRLMEVPVGFKWFAPGLFDGSVCFGGEESAGASFLRMDGGAWSTDKDGILLALLAAEMTAVTGKDPGVHYRELTAKFGEPFYARIDAPASPEQKAAFKKLTPPAVKATTLAGDAIEAKLTNAPGNNASIGGLKVTTKNGWFAARPSGTENIYKIYAESFVSQVHLDEIIREAQSIVGAALAG